MAPCLQPRINLKYVSLPRHSSKRHDMLEPCIDIHVVCSVMQFSVGAMVRSWSLMIVSHVGAMPGCGNFAATASGGRWSYGRTALNSWGTSLVWWAGDFSGDLEILLHEIGHTYGMGHASISGGCKYIDQCDHTCTMGNIGGQYIRCFNAAHNWQVGRWRASR